MKQWTVQDTETLDMYPVTSENMANEFTRLLNGLVEENEQLQKKLIYLIENGLKELFSEKYRIIEDISDGYD